VDLGILEQGIKILCENDKEIDNLISPRYEEIITLLNLYIKEIETFNPAYGLVGTTDTNELIIKHILDSLAPLGIISRLLTPSSLCDLCASAEPSVRSLRETLPKKIADAGSGAGLPGIPLAIVLNQCNFTLIERMGRRAGFLLNTKAVLALHNISIEENELEQVACKQAACGQTFNLVTFRAFKPLEPKLLKTLLKVCAPGGIIAAYKGKLEKTEAEMAPLQTAWEAIPYTVPFLGDERHILAIKAK